MSSTARRYRALLLLGMLLSATSAWCASNSWQSWTFDDNITDYEGLQLKNVKFQGRPLLRAINFPVMRVFYKNNVCGPFVDLLGAAGGVSPIPWADNATLAKREITVNGKLWYEIGIRDQLGNYDMYQVFYLSADGVIDAHIYARGLQCIIDHLHYPNWRIDFDIDGPAGDQILRNPGTGWEVISQEFNAGAASVPGHAWRVRDVTTGLYVDVLPGFADFSIPDGVTNVPSDSYANHTVFGRLYKASEDHEWYDGPNTQVPGGNGENIDNQDVVFWYEGYLPHLASEGSGLWHSTGVRLVSSLVPQGTDTDGDGTVDTADNCKLVANASQLDTNLDGYGNLCDADLDNDGRVNFTDLGLFKARFTTSDPDANLDGIGVVDFADLAIFKALFGKPPGPSGSVP